MAMSDFSKGFFVGAGVLVALLIAGLAARLVRV
jgi:hypothetical protein